MLGLADVENEYCKNPNLDKSKVDGLIQWVHQQPHLPEINELQAILFLHSCDNDEETASKTVENFFTMKTTMPHLFKNRNPLESPLKESLDVALCTPLPKKTPEGFTILLIKLMDFNPKKLDLVTQLKLFDMVCMMHLHQDGTSDGHVAVIDLKGTVFGHLFRVKPFVLKSFFRYVLEGIPGKVKRIHFVNKVVFMDKVLAVIKPLMRKELVDMIHLHDGVGGLAEFIPLDCLPEDYGGVSDSVVVLHDRIKKRVCGNVEFFRWEDEQNVDESKRMRQTGWFRKR